MTYLLQTNHLTKTIKDKDLVSNINLHVKREKSTDSLGQMGLEKPPL